MTSEVHNDPLKWPAAYPVSCAGDDRAAWAICITTVILGLGGVFVMFFFDESRITSAPPPVAAAMATETAPPAPSTAPAVADKLPPDMNTLGPEFGAWILKKHPEMQDQVEKLQQHLQTLCASINAICSRQDTRFDPAGTCKSRPPACAQ